MEAGRDPGPEEDHSATYRLGRDPVGYSASVEDLDEDLAEDGGATPTIRGSAHVFLGFQDGGGPIQDTGTDSPTQRTAPDTAQDTGIPT